MMSMWIDLRDAKGNTAEVASFEAGGSYALGGSTDASLNVTYNYSAMTYALRIPNPNITDDNGCEWWSFWSLNGMSAADTIATLEQIVEWCGVKQWNDYWAPTPGNVGYAASILLAWAKQYPDYVWDVR